MHACIRATGLLGGRRRSGAAAAVAVLETRRQDSDLQLSVCQNTTRRITGEGIKKIIIRIMIPNDRARLYGVENSVWR